MWCIFNLWLITSDCEWMVGCFTIILEDFRRSTIELQYSIYFLASHLTLILKCISTVLFLFCLSTINCTNLARLFSPLFLKKNQFLPHSFDLSPPTISYWQLPFASFVRVPIFPLSLFNCSKYRTWRRSSFLFRFLLVTRTVLKWQRRIPSSPTIANDGTRPSMRP